MNATNLKIIFRGIKKQKLPNLLSILVLTAGAVSFILIFFYIRYEKSFDQSWTDADQIYRINLNQTMPDGTVSKTATNYQALGWVLTDEIPGIAYSTSLWEDKVMIYTPEEHFITTNFYWGDASFFKVFGVKFLYGDAQNPYPTIQSIVISQTTSRILFGTENSIGKHLKINEGWEFNVSGVFEDLPKNAHIKLDMLGTCTQLFYYLGHYDNATSKLKTESGGTASLPSPSGSWLWQNPDAHTYIKIKKGVTLSSIIAGFDGIYNKYTSHLLAVGQKSEFVLQPVSSIHIGQPLKREISTTIDSRTMKALWIVAILALVMSWIIFINFQITLSMDRAKEIGLKKMAGAKPYDLSIQIVLQSLLINLVSLAISIGLFFFLRKPLSQYLELYQILPVKPGSLFLFIALFLLGSILIGLYPALMLIPRKAYLLMSKNFVQKNDGLKLRRALTTFQFVASIGLLIATSVIIKQVSFMKNKDIGLNISHTMYSYIPLSDLKKPGCTERLKSFMDEINRMPEVESSSVSSSIPGKAIDMHANNIYPIENPDKAGINYGILTVSHNFGETYKPRMLAGRFYKQEDPEGSKVLVINHEACTKLGFNSPDEAIGRFVNVDIHDFLEINNTNYQICGVVEDFHQESPRKIVEPLLMINNMKWKYDIGYISIAYSQQASNSTITAVKEKWNSFFPAEPFNFQYTDDNYQLQMKYDERLAGLFAGYTVLSILLAVLGLFGLTANVTRKRVKEIGIRKVNGARTSEILVLLNRDFMMGVILAFAIAAPIAFFAMQKWLQNFAYKTNLSWWIFGLAGFLAMAIAFITISWQSWTAATRNPVEALRYE